MSSVFNSSFLNRRFSSDRSVPPRRCKSTSGVFPPKSQSITWKPAQPQRACRPTDRLAGGAGWGAGSCVGWKPQGQLLSLSSGCGLRFSEEGPKSCWSLQWGWEQENNSCWWQSGTRFGNWKKKKKGDEMQVFFFLMHRLYKMDKCKFKNKSINRFAQGFVSLSDKLNTARTLPQLLLI